MHIGNYERDKVSRQQANLLYLCMNMYYTLSIQGIGFRWPLSMKYSVIQRKMRFKLKETIAVASRGYQVLCVHDTSGKRVKKKTPLRLCLRTAVHMSVGTLRSRYLRNTLVSSDERFDAWPLLFNFPRCRSVRLRQGIGAHARRAHGS